MKEKGVASMKGSKQQIEKLVWAWSETTEPEQVTTDQVRTAYRLHLKSCTPNNCRRNCRSNPLCVVGLGQRPWLEEIKDASWHDVDDPINERRQSGSFVGLKNLGATCYVNTFLQVWFHNPAFRGAILRWRELDTQLNWNSIEEHQPRACTNPVTAAEAMSGALAAAAAAVAAASGAESEDQQERRLMPLTVCGHLQLVFALLQHSSRKYIDPTALIHSLGLDTGQQQDAQEFSKLFISLLEDTFSQQAAPSVHNLVQQQFLGRYDYVTRCSKCGGQSHCASQFYELDLNIKGHHDLHGCLGEFLQEEKLEGDNQYACRHCAGKQDARRRITLTSLPPTLNVQLLRFVFDRKTGHKKKLNTYIQFPETLDLSEYMAQDEGSIVYELRSVLIHRGPSAYSGHYMAYIYDPQSDGWLKFNDEQIEKIGSKGLKLGNEDDTIEPKGGAAKKPKTPKGCHNSRNAYMLVYSRQDQAPAQPDPEIPRAELSQRVQDYIQFDNTRFERWITDMGRMREENVSRGRQMQAEIREIVSHLRQTQGAVRGEFEWMRTKWLTTWLAAGLGQPVAPPDNTDLLCPHGRLDIDKVAEMKCVSPTAGAMLHAQFGGSPRLRGEASLCRACVVARCQVVRTRTRIAEDSKVITALLKSKDSACTAGFWVGKSSLRSWRRLAEERFKASLKPTGSGVSAGADRETTPTDQRNGSAHVCAQSPGTSSTARDTGAPCSSACQAADHTEPSRVSGTEPHARTSTGQSSPVQNSPGPTSPVKKPPTNSAAISPVPINPGVTSPGHIRPVQSPVQASSVQTSSVHTSSVHTSPGVANCGRINSVTMSGGKKSPAVDCDGSNPVSALTVTEKHVGCDASTERPQAGSLEGTGGVEAAQAPTQEAGQGTGGQEAGQGTGGQEAGQGTGGQEAGQGTGPQEADRLGEVPEVEQQSFNEDLLCNPHGALSVDPGCRRLVPPDIWRRLQTHFPSAPSFPHTAPVCPQCQGEQEEEERAAREQQERATDMRHSLGDLYHDRNRPVWGPKLWQLYVIPTAFLLQWRAFIKDPHRHTAPQLLGNQQFLCHHGNFMFDPQTIGLSPDTNSLSLVTQEEWQTLCGFVAPDSEVSVSRIEEDSGHVTFICSPDVCEECSSLRQATEHQSRLTYTSATIYIRQLTDNNAHFVADAGSAAPPAGEAAVTVRGSSSEEEDEYSLQANKKKRKKSPAGPAEKIQKVDPGLIRRSTRHRKLRGEKSVTTPSTATLRDLKLQVMKLFSVAPFDQHLVHNGQELQGDQTTLAALGILPDTVLYLKADEAVDDPTFYDDPVKASSTEEGFKGTGLLAR